jgi:hypothetical protein
MARKKIEPEKSAHEIAYELLEIRQELNNLKQAEKLLSDQLRKRMVAGEDQDYFKFVPVTTLKIADAPTALQWAQKHAPQVITINTTLARKVFLGNALTGSIGTPEQNGFALKTVDQLREIKEGEMAGPEDIINSI